MKHFITLFITIACCLTVFSQNISYRLSMPEPHTHYFHVSMEINDLSENFIDIKMPVWAPGSYLIREFAKNVENLTANSDGKPLPMEIVNKNTWRLNTKGIKKLNINYQVYAFEMSVRTSFLDASHGYLNGTSLFMYVDGKKELPVKLHINPYPEWKKVATSLKRTDQKSFVYEAPDYDVLVDSPVEIGNHEEFEFQAAGLTHKVAMYGQGNYNVELLQKDMAKIVEECTNVIGENPNQSYTFIIHNLTHGSGGLEHLSSTTLQVNRWGYSPESNYLGFLSLVTHEYFHLWNVKRIRPVALGPFDYDQENYTNLLWLCEGFTSYYDELLLKRAGYYDSDKYLKELSGSISRVENQPGNKVQPVTEASFHAWIKAYRPNENSYNTTISYYPKGALLATMLDLEIINNTNGEKNIDHVLQLLYNEYYKKQKRGFTDAEFKKAVEQIAGKNLDEFFNENVAGTKTIDYNKYLNYAGCQLVNTNAGNTSVLLGINTKNEEGKLTVTRVISGTSAYESGINVNDEIIAINGYRIGDNSLSELMDQYQPGDNINMLISRDGIVQELPVLLKKDDNLRHHISRVENPSEAQNLVYNKWLKEN